MSRNNEKQAEDQPQAPIGIIREEVMTLGEACKRLQWGQETLADAIRDGFRVLHYGSVDYVLGADVLRFFQVLADTDTIHQCQSQRSLSPNAAKPG